MDFITGEIIGIDKPLGWTSFDAVKRIRGAIQRRLGVRKFKVGHAGTLDPLATGVLVICTGRATRRISALQEGMKEYVAEIRLGATTPSFDLETEIDAAYPFAHVTPQLVLETLPRFTGRVMQVPPVFSAVKVDGKRAYSFARKGHDVELKPKELEIRELEMLGYDGASGRLTLRVLCSKGTRAGPRPRCRTRHGRPPHRPETHPRRRCDRRHLLEHRRGPEAHRRRPADLPRRVSRGAFTRNSEKQL